MSDSTDSLGRLALVLVAALLLVPFLMMLFVGGPMMGWWMMGGTPFGAATANWWVVPALGAVGLLAGLLLVYALYRVATTPGDRALDELRTAYARGEVDDDEYEHRRRMLGGSG
ncbi:SHOCT domain-containing protein [Halomarina litorea]|uniref:SHOCT domain-containing protein n=1 Tax=Halomarina litorea TaxID=2961595 RepID=UPI0020C40728|nr:SHOCT domain-containing protein [Halomarina sp. BCD28]